MATGRLPPLAAAYVDGRDRDLLAPLRYLDPGEVPAGAPPRADRGALARALEVANAGYGHPAAARLAEKLADPDTRVVVTGQQPGLYGGPLLTFSKMVATVRWAETFEAAGVPSVAVFWVATEDHDWAEVARASFLGRREVETFDLGEDPAPLMPVGMRTFGPDLERVAAEVTELLGGDLATASLEAAHRWYRPDARFGEAFCRFLIHLLGERAPLMLDSMLPEAKRLQAPWLTALVERRDEVDAVQRRADAQIERRGYDLQVSPQRGVSPLFLLHRGERRRIVWVGDDRYALRGQDGAEPRPVSQLLEIVQENPAIVSPGVLARPAIQDALLGTTLQVMGPSELSYMAQVAPLYPLLEIDPPATTLRPQALVVNERYAGYLDELGVGLAELFDTPLEQILADRLGDDFVTPVRQEIETLFDSLKAPAVALDPGLEGPWRKTRDHVGRGLDQLSGKIAAAVARRNDVWLRRLEQVKAAWLPGGALQERGLSTLHFYARYGPDLARHFPRQLGLDPRTLHIVRLS